MIRKADWKPQSFWSKWGKIIVFSEIVIVAYSYFVYSKLNRSEAFRYQYSQKHPKILSAFYQVGETLGGLDTRQTDQERWKAYDKKKTD